jgi:hypothetical protein
MTTTMPIGIERQQTKLCGGEESELLQGAGHCFLEFGLYLKIDYEMHLRFAPRQSD